MRRRQLAAMTAWVLAGARSQPVVLAFEDLHWADPTSLDLMRALAERGAQAPLLIVATTRPEFRPPWSLRSHHSVISLAPLDRAQVARMVGEIASRHALSNEVIEGVSERTGGVPLFVEEVTRLLLERGAQGGAQAIPPTLQQSLAARLDRLGEAREVAQIGAVLGRDFSYRLLRDVSSSAAGFDEPRLQAALDRLAEADLLFVEGAPPTATYRFKHALIQDAAYDSLLKSRRQALHRRAAEALRDAHAEPEAIAHHFTEAGLDDLAIEWWGKAGDQALRRSAFQEAIAHLGKAIAMADKAGATARRAPGSWPLASQRLTQLHVAYGNALFAARGYGAPETTKPSPEPASRRPATRTRRSGWRPITAYGPAATCEASCRRCGRTRRPSSATSRRDPIRPRPASPIAPPGSLAGSPASIAKRGMHLERALALFQPGRDDDLAFRFGQDAGVAAMFYLAIVLWPLGDVERAISLVDNAADADREHHACRHARAWGNARGLVRIDARRPRARRAERIRTRPPRARARAALVARVRACFSRAWRRLKAARPASGLEDMRRGAELLARTELLTFDGLLKIALAEAEARAGDPDRALAILDEALATSDRTRLSRVRSGTASGRAAKFC